MRNTPIQLVRRLQYTIVNSTQKQLERIGNHKVKLEIISDCPNYQKIAKELVEVDAYKEIFNKPHMGRVYEVFAKYSPHVSCPSVSGILKTIEVAADLALQKNATITITKE